VNTSGGGIPYTHLNVTIELNVSTPGDNYVVTAGLFDRVNKTFITTATSNVTNGENNITVSFNGSKIYKKQYNGTFEFKAKLFDTTGGKWFECDRYSSITDSYNYTDFTPVIQDATIVGYHSNYTNESGFLLINYTININRINTWYELYGDLFDSTGTAYIKNAFNDTFDNSSQGDVIVSLIFSNSSINGHTSPFNFTFIRLSVFDDEQDIWEEIDVDIPNIIIDPE
jgi:hypothetical protein